MSSGRKAIFPLRILFPVLFLLALIASAVPAQEEGEEQKGAAQGTGTHVFRRSLHELGFKPLESFEELGEQPSETILVVLGRIDWLHQHPPGWLRSYVVRGGALLLATDQPPGDQFQLQQVGLLTGVTVTGESILVENEYRYHGYNFCPMVLADRGSGPSLFRNPRQEDGGPLEVFANLPSRLFVLGPVLPPGIVPVAWLPRESMSYRERGGETQAVYLSRNERLFGVAGQRGEGKVLVLADHSIFINTMMLPQDTGNVEFASNCMTWLSEGPQGKRQRVLFLEEGEINSTFEVPLVERPLPELSEDDLRKLAANMSQVLARLEDHDSFNRAIWQMLGRRYRPERVGRILVILLTVGIVVFALYRITTRGKHSAEKGRPPLGRAARKHTPPAMLSELRLRSQLQTGNLWEAASQLARGVFLEAGIDPSEGTPPVIGSSGGLLQRWRVRRRVLRFWRLAQGSRPFLIQPRQWRQFAQQLESLQDDLATGVITLTVARSRPEAGAPAAAAP